MVSDDFNSRLSNLIEVTKSKLAEDGDMYVSTSRFSLCQLDALLNPRQLLRRLRTILGRDR